MNSAPEVAIEFLPALFAKFPELIGKIPWVSLRGTSNPSVPVALKKTQHWYGENYVHLKREDLDFHTLPDNKARKLEFVMGDALERRAKKLVSSGYVGSSHCMALASAARQLDLKSNIYLRKAPLSKESIEMTSAMKAMGSKVKICGSERALRWSLGWQKFLSKFFRIDMVSEGGGSALGAIGYVSAMFELAQQIDEGELPPIDLLFVPVGSGATLVGMELGRRLAELSGLQIIGVQASDDRFLEPEHLERLASDAVQILNRGLRSKLNAVPKVSDFTIDRGYIFGGHGQTPAFLETRMLRLLELEGIELDPVYTGKAFFGMCEYIKRHKLQQKSILFWNTHSPFRRSDVADPLDVKTLPRRIRSWIREEQHMGRLVDVAKA